MAKHFRVEGKKIIANVGALTANELNSIKNYIALGYELTEGKVNVSNENDKKPNEKWTEETIRKYIEKNGTKEEKETYDKLYNAPTKDNAVYKNDVYKTTESTDENGKKHKRTEYDEKGNKIIIHKAGEPRKQGHVGTLAWFKRTFPNY